MTKELKEKIAQLSAAEMIEAATFVANIILIDGDIDTAAQIESLSGRSDYVQYTEDFQDVAKLVLYNAADNEAYAGIVERAIANTGKKNLVLGGAELIALGVIGLAALKILKNPVKKEKITHIDKDGATIASEKEYDSSIPFLADVLKAPFLKFLSSDK